MQACTDFEITGTVLPETPGMFGSISLEAIEDAASYEWEPAGSGQILEDLEFGLYTVTVTTNSGCTNSEEFIVEIDNSSNSNIIGGERYIPSELLCDDCCYTWKRQEEGLDGDGNNIESDRLELCEDENGNIITPRTRDLYL